MKSTKKSNNEDINYYEEIKNLIIDNEVYSKVKDYAKERNKVKTYYEIGQILSIAGKEYGKNIIVNYGDRLSKEIGNKYNYRTLYRMRKLYEVFSNQKLTPLVSKLSWSHYLQVLSLKSDEEIIYYVNQAYERNLGKRELSKIVKNKEYERLDEETKIKLMKNKEQSVIDFVKNPILIRNSSKFENISEKILKQLILEDIELFMNELGPGFSYIDNEYKIKVGDRNNYIDLLLYNYKYKCFVVVELKITELMKNHIGQIEVYMNYIDKNIKSIDDNKTIGIIICKKNNNYVIDYCSDNRILGREYKLI